MKNFQLKKYLPYFTAIVIFLLITMIYFSPLFEGKKIYQSDIVNFTGMSKEIVDYRDKTGKEPLWTNAMFGGMPAYQISVVYKANIIGFLDKILTLGLPHPANLVFLYFLGFFILLLVMKVDPWLSIAGAMAFAFSSYFFIIIDAGHNSKAHAIAYMAPVIAGILLTFQKKYLWGGLLTAIFLSLEIKANHPQITYYLLIIVLLLGVFKLIHAIRFNDIKAYLKVVGILIIAATFGILTNITTLWATYEYSKDTIRGKSELTIDQDNKTSGLDKDYATQWSYGVGETMTLLIPDFYGGSSSTKLSENSAIVKALKKNNIPSETIRQFTSQPVPFLYWGAQPFTSGPVYIGAIVCFLFVLGLILVKGPIKWWLLSATLLSILLSWGHNFIWLTDLFLTYVPGYNKFRAVTMILVIAEFCMPLLGILALKEIFGTTVDRKKALKSIQIATLITGGIALIFAVIPTLFLNFTGPNDAAFQQQFPDWLMQAIRDERLRLVKLDAIRSLVFILLSAALLWIFLKEKLKQQYVYAGLILLILLDMFIINKRYLNNESFTTKNKVEKPFKPTPADEQILLDHDPDFRVLNLATNTFNDASTSYFHKSIGGYHGAKLRRYQELIENQIQKNNMSVLNMLNTKYIIFAGQNNEPIAQFNPDALGHAWFVKGYKLVGNADEELNSLTHFNPADTAIIDKRFGNKLTGYTPGRDSAAVIMLDSYQPNQLVYQYTTNQNSLAVFSEIYYPNGWNAYIDGTLSPHFRTNYILRAMVLPAGNHTLTFKFEPNLFNTGEMISLISSIILLVLVVVFGLFEARKAWKSNA